MIKKAHRIACRLLPLSLFAAPIFGQATSAVVASPRYEGFHLPDAQGSLSYAVNVSERIDHGYNGNDTTGYSSNFGGDLAYLSNSQTHPFSMVYSGGYLVGTSNQSSSFYQNLALSQVLTFQKWTVVVSDAVNYLPQTPTAGLSGIPGVGDGGIPPVDIGAGSDQTILTENSSRVSNSVTGSVQRAITGKTFLNVFGSYGLLDYLDNDTGISGLSSMQDSVGGGFSRRINARSNFTTNYTYTNFRYSSGNQISFASQSLNVGYVRQFTRKVSLNVSLGPQRTSSFALVDPLYNLSAIVGASYTGEVASYSVGYSSGTNNGSGVATGATTQNVFGNLSRPFGRAWHGSASLAYSRSTGLPVLGSSAFTTNSVIGAAQFNRALGHDLSTFISYTAQRQVLQGSVASSNPFTGLSQVLGFGLTYAPESHHLGGR